MTVRLRLGNSKRATRLSVGRKDVLDLPMIIVLLLFGTILVFAQGSAIEPFIYTLY